MTEKLLMNISNTDIEAILRNDYIKEELLITGKAITIQDLLDNSNIPIKEIRTRSYFLYTLVRIVYVTGAIRTAKLRRKRNQQVLEYVNTNYESERMLTIYKDGITIQEIIRENSGF